MISGRTTYLGFFALSLLLLGTAGGWGQVIPNTPRALGMGNAFVAVSDDEGAILANPAGMALAREGRISVGSLGLTDLQNHWYSAYMLPPSSGRVQGTALSFAKTETQAGVRTDRMTWSAGQYYAHGVAVGLNLHFLRASTTAGAKDKAFGVDLGVIYELPGKPGHESPGTVGVLVRNPNEPNLLGDTLPRVISVGVALRPYPGVLVAADSYNIFDEAGAPQEQSVGVEYVPIPGIALRAGYLSKAGIVTLGAGLQGEAFDLDVAWASGDGGDDTGYVGMSFLF